MGTLGNLLESLNFAWEPFRGNLGNLGNGTLLGYVWEPGLAREPLPGCLGTPPVNVGTLGIRILDAPTCSGTSMTEDPKLALAGKILQPEDLPVLDSAAPKWWTRITLAEVLAESMLEPVK